jgi:hypothetical protein
LVGVAAESLDEFTTNKKKNIAPIVETVIDIKNTLTDTPFIESVARSGLQTARVLPDIIGNTVVVVSDLIKVRQIIGWNKQKIQINCCVLSSTEYRNVHKCVFFHSFLWRIGDLLLGNS